MNRINECNESLTSIPLNSFGKLLVAASQNIIYRFGWNVSMCFWKFNYHLSNLNVFIMKLCAWQLKSLCVCSFFKYFFCVNSSNWMDLTCSIILLINNSQYNNVRGFSSFGSHQFICYLCGPFTRKYGFYVKFIALESVFFFCPHVKQHFISSSSNAINKIL